MNRDLCQILMNIEETNSKAWIVVVTKSDGSTPAKPGMKMIVYADGSIYGTIGGGQLEYKCIQYLVEKQCTKIETIDFTLKGKNQGNELGMICGGELTVYIEPLFNPNKLYIIGGGHCGMELSSLAVKAGFHVTVIDDREEWTAIEKHPTAHTRIFASYDTITQHIDFSTNPYIVIMTHNHLADENVLWELIRQSYAYIGVIGSKVKVKLYFDRLLSSGYTREELLRVHAPIGLDIGSQTPTEIAISVLAQIIAIKNGRKQISLSSNILAKEPK